MPEEGVNHVGPEQMLHSAGIHCLSLTEYILDTSVGSKRNSEWKKYRN